MIKKILIGCGIFFVVLMIIGGLASEDTTPKAAEATPSEVKQTEPTPPEPKVTETALQQKNVKAKAEIMDKNKLTDAKKAEIVAYFKGDDEPSVKDALFPYSTLKLGMHNDGSSRDGFAKYTCQILQSEFSVTELVTVSIIDIDKLVHTDKWVKIGKANCI